MPSIALCNSKFIYRFQLCNRLQCILLYVLPMHPEGRFILIKFSITKISIGTNQQTPSIVNIVKRQIIMFLSLFYLETNSPWLSCCFLKHVVLLPLAAVLSFKADRYCVWVGNTASWDCSLLCSCLESLVRSVKHLTLLRNGWVDVLENKPLLHFCSSKPAERNFLTDKDGDVAFVTDFNGIFELTISVSSGKDHLLLSRLS